MGEIFKPHILYQIGTYKIFSIFFGLGIPKLLIYEHANFRVFASNRDKNIENIRLQGITNISSEFCLYK